MRLKTKLTLLAAIMIPLTSAMQAGEQDDKAVIEPVDPWKAEIALYGWLPGIEGTTGVGNQLANVDVGFGELVDELDFGFAAIWGIQYDRFGFSVDTLYSRATPSGDTPGGLFSSVDLDISQLLFDFKSSYRVIDTGRTKVELLAGARRNDIDTDLTFQPGAFPVRVFVNTGESWWDVLGGVRISQYLNDRLFVVFAGDVGGGESELTYQLVGRVGYELNDHVSLGLGYRYLDYDFTGDSGFVYDVATSGLILGVQFSF